MSKKNWIYLKRGLSQDAKHREAIGNRIWVFLHIIDRADWESGIAQDWRDKDEAEDMGIAWRTLQKQRQELDELGYITCKKTKHGQNIAIHNWINPRDYSGGIVNATKGVYPELGTECTQESTPKSTQRSYRDLGTPSIESINQESIIIKRTKRADPLQNLFPIAEALSKVCAMDLAANKGRLFKAAKTLSLATIPPTAELITANYNGDPNAFWKKQDWRGKQGQRPTPSAIIETWGQWGLAPIPSASKSGGDSYTATLAKIAQEDEVARDAH